MAHHLTLTNPLTPGDEPSSRSGVSVTQALGSERRHQPSHHARQRPRQLPGHARCHDPTRRMHPCTPRRADPHRTHHLPRSVLPFGRCAGGPVVDQKPDGAKPPPPFPPYPTPPLPLTPPTRPLENTLRVVPCRHVVFFISPHVPSLSPHVPCRHAAPLSR